MNKNLLKRIASVATELDQFGFTREAKSLDLILLKLAKEEMEGFGPEKDKEPEKDKKPENYFDEKEKEKQEMLAKQQEYLDNLQQKAIIFLLENGKVLGQDFTVENAINSANQLKFEQLIKEKLKSSSEFPFYGENCDEDCGWDGISHRCFCGNRRVDWEYNGNFENMDVYAEAY